jgi:transposase
MRNGKRGRYTLAFKQEAVRLVEFEQSVARAAGSLGVVEQTLSNWVKAHLAGTLQAVVGKSAVTVIIEGLIGGPGRDRTDDLFHAMEARSQLRHRPTLRRE